MDALIHQKVRGSNPFGRTAQRRSPSLPLEEPQSRRWRPRRTRRRGDGLRPERGYLPRRPAPDAQFSNLSHDSFRYVWNGKLPGGTDPHERPAETGVGELRRTPVPRPRSIEHPCDVRGKEDHGGRNIHVVSVDGSEPESNRNLVR